MQSGFAQVCANSGAKQPVWDHRRVAQKDLVASLRAFRRADDRLRQARADLDEAIQQAVSSGEWQIVDIAELTGWSRETVRKIATLKP